MRKIFSHLKEYLRWYILLLLIITSILLWASVLQENHKGILKFVVLDVGQGDSLFIESPTGLQVLIDGGPGNSLSKEIGKVMPWYDRHIDMLVITNPDADHYEGFIKVLDKYSVDVVMEPGTTNTYTAYTFLQDKFKQKNVPKILARRGQIVDLGAGAYLEIIFPDRDVSELSPNDGSMVMRLVYGETSIMLQGDSTSRMEEYLLSKDGINLKSTILKVGHHGSKTSSQEEYVSSISPELAVISSGINNRYGHPHKETLDTMQKLKIPTYSTCNNGRIIFESDGKNFVMKNKNITESVVGCKIQ